VEQAHIKDAFVFELSKVETPAIRVRMVGHLRHVDEHLAQAVAAGLGLRDMPEPARAAHPARDLPLSPALSIQRNPPASFAGRKIGVLITEGVDAALLGALRDAAAKEGAMVELVAPVVGGVQASDGSWIEAQQKVNGGPSVLYDAVALLPSEKGASLLAHEATARDFVNDAFAHAKFIAYATGAKPLLARCGMAAELDGGFLPLSGEKDARSFIVLCRQLRFWEREARLHPV